MSYDYTCKDCGHEFDYNEGVKFMGMGEIVSCSHCRGFNVKDLTNEGE